VSREATRALDKANCLWYYGFGAGGIMVADDQL